MPFWIQGWLEVTTDGPHDAEAIWQAVVDLGPLVDTSDGVSEHLFGLSKRFDRISHYATVHCLPNVAFRLSVPLRWAMRWQTTASWPRNMDQPGSAATHSRTTQKFVRQA